MPQAALQGPQEATHRAECQPAAGHHVATSEAPQALAAPQEARAAHPHARAGDRGARRPGRGGQCDVRRGDLPG
eukprot:74510-Alexandrium_andersonii.AAC.1